VRPQYAAAKVQFDWRLRLRNQKLDILRAVAVLLVLGRHSEGPRFWNFVGWVGVDLFFVLSGFLISGLLFAEYKATGDIGWKRFFVRRGFKIYPAYYALILATFVWQIAAHEYIPFRLYVPELLMYQNYAEHLWLHTWSLAVEEHFYIFLPLILLLLVRWRSGKYSSEPFRAVPHICLIISIACLLQRLYVVMTLPDLASNWGYVLFRSHLRFDSLFFGVFLGYLHHFRQQELTRFMAMRLPRILLPLASVILLLPCTFLAIQSKFLLVFGLTSLYLGFGGLLICALYGWRNGKTGAPTAFRKFGIPAIAAYIGKYSYSIYLWHPMISQHDQAFLHFVWPHVAGKALFAGNILVELVVGIALSLAIEGPALNFRDRYFPSLQSVHSAK